MALVSVVGASAEGTKFDSWLEIGHMGIFPFLPKLYFPSPFHHTLPFPSLFGLTLKLL